MPTSTLTTVGPFVNEPITDYRKPENVRGMREAIAKVRAQLGREYDLVIGGKHIRTDGQDCLHQPGESVRSDRHSPEGRRRTRRARHAGGARRLRHVAVCLAWKSAPACCSAPPKSCAGASSNSTPGWCSKSARTTTKPKPIPPKPSTSWNSTRARRWCSTRPNRSSNCPASAASCATSRSAWAR